MRVRYHNKWGALRNYDMTFEGVIDQLERRYKETDSEYIKEEIEQYMTSLPCPDCKGTRLKPESLSVKIGAKNIAEYDRADRASGPRVLLHADRSRRRERLIAQQILKEIKARLTFLVNVGLDYLTLDRTAEYAVRRRSAAYPSGDADRQRADGRALRPGRAEHRSAPARQRAADPTLGGLRDLGNTILVVEHDEETIRSADWVVDIGPGRRRRTADTSSPLVPRNRRSDIRRRSPVNICPGGAASPSGAAPPGIGHALVVRRRATAQPQEHRRTTSRSASLSP